jgi:hypothetical protein
MFVATGLLALVVAAAESLLEYPLQRPATLFLTLGAIGFVCHGNPPGLPRRVFILSAPRLGASAVVLTGLAAGFVYAGYCSEIAGALYRSARGGTIESTVALARAYGAYLANPLDREIRVSLPVFVDARLRAYGQNSLPAASVDRAYAIAETAGPYNTVVLIGRAQRLLNSDRADDPALVDILDALRRGSGHVPATYVIQARYDMARGDVEAARQAIVQGRSLAQAALGVDETAPAVLQLLDGLDGQLPPKP